jgi:hypothetical protein
MTASRSRSAVVSAQAPPSKMDSPWNHNDGATFACMAESALIYQERVIKYERDGLRFWPL